MSNLPPIDYQKVAQRLTTELGSAVMAKATVEILAETLRNERDAALDEVNQLRAQLNTQRGAESNAAQS